jgi:hypothetical protein
MANTKKHKPLPISAEDFDRKFDSGEDVSEHLDESKATWRLPVSFPTWMKTALDAEAIRLGVSRSAVINLLVDDGLRRIRQRERQTGS